ncbi:MAG TPA: hypothetical protein VJQ06_05675 [Rhizomicrobium sp.]|nr:hypothetical protein [Rhizomicrobium sp.]
MRGAYAHLATARATPLPPPEPSGAEQAYQERLKNYRALTQSYKRRMRDHNRLHAQAGLEERRWQDAARLDPWRGYNPMAATAIDRDIAVAR